MMDDFTTRESVNAVYRKRARFYDISANLYYLIGFREQAYRRMAVGKLGLRPGDAIVEIGCGTGLNFSLIEDGIGPAGRIIGVDQSPEMLEQAQRRIARRGWTNIELVRSSAADYRFPARTDGVLSTLALTLEPEYDAVIAKGAASLAPGRRWVVMDLRLPANWLWHLAPMLVFFVRPFAVSLKLTERHPWESIARHLNEVTYGEVYFGIVYIATGQA